MCFSEQIAVTLYLLILFMPRINVSAIVCPLLSYLAGARGGDHGAFE